MADGNAAKRVQAIIKSNEARRYIVVSAPGKRFEGDTKITDVLYAAAGAAKENRSGDFKRAFGEVCGRFLSLARETAADGRFLNGLKAELEEIKAVTVERTRKTKLEAFQRKLAGLKFLDPACGSGNFLTETY